MSLPLEDTPAVQIAQSAVSASQALKLQVSSIDDLDLRILLEPRYVEPSPLASDQTNYDYLAILRLTKPIYDFGRQGNAEDAAEANLSAQNLRYRTQLNQHRLVLMTRFFATVLADLAFIRDNEAMSVAFVRLDRLQAKKKLGQTSDIDLLEQEQVYQRARLTYFSSQAQQQISRSQLAQALNRPNDLVAEIAEPKPLPATMKIPEYESLLEQVLARNPTLQSYRHVVSAAQSEMQAARAERRPSLEAQAQAAEYRRQLGNRNTWEVELQLSVPLWQGDRVSGRVATASAKLLEARARLREIELQLRHQTRQLVQELNLLNISRQQKQQQVDYRDLYLDLSRARYEMEVNSDLGDAMVQVSAARYDLVEVNLNIMLAWARLNALLGKPVYPIREAKHE